MSDINLLQHQISKSRSELKNLRQQIQTLKRVHTKEVAEIKHLVKHCKSDDVDVSTPQAQAEYKRDNAVSNDPTSDKAVFTMKPIGHIKSMYKDKNGTPRQSGICPQSKATLTINKTIFTNPEHSLHGCHAFSHVWLIFVFHQNNSTHVRAKVAPPRLNGAKVGVFSTRCPHRPNPVGLTLAKVESIKGCTLQLSGIDLIDGTPILDIKPFIPQYDSPQHLTTTPGDNLDCSSCQQPNLYKITDSVSLLKEEGTNENINRISWETDEDRDMTTSDNSHVSAHASTLQTLPDGERYTPCEEIPPAKIARWIEEAPVPELSVTFTTAALNNISLFHKDEDKDELYKLSHLDGNNELKAAVECSLKADPRSSYRRKRCSDRLYYFTVDTAHITAWFHGDEAQVLRVAPRDLKQDQTSIN